MKISITGGDGFIGSHLSNTIKYKYKEIELLPFKKSFFTNKDSLDKLIGEIDVLIHLAGINRHDDPDYLYKHNTELCHKIVESIKRTNFSGKIIFASSTQEKLDSAYGKAKKNSREMFTKASKTLGFSFLGLIIPNVFGPFCKPNYNSFISTFCNNTILNKQNIIKKNNKIPLIYINNVIEIIINKIYSKNQIKEVLKEDVLISVSDVKDLIDSYYSIYYRKGIIPRFNSEFQLNLFNTFNSFILLDQYYPKQLNQKSDNRGIFSEVVRSNMLGQYSYSITNPGEVRGNHFHTRKIERFAVISGNAIIELRKIGTTKKITFNIKGETPCYVDMPIWHTHNIKNVGETPLITLFWINEFYNEDDSDTFFEKV